MDRDSTSNWRSSALWLLLAGAPWPAVAADNRAAELEAPSVEVVSTTPLPGIGTPVNQVPANVQAVTAAQMAGQRPVDLVEYIDNNLGSVNLNSSQANAFQPDVNYRGFAASPLMGVPQGISVFVDGVRVNEAFGDTVNWDLIPQSAISSISLIPGSNPVFGLNTLGGALSVQTKSGKTYPGASLTAYGGSWHRRGAEFEVGGKRDKFDYFLTGNFLDEDGWRAGSPSRIRQLFGKVGWEDERDDVDLSVALADNTLFGTQALPLSMLGNPAQPYTWPDSSKNKAALVNLKASHFLTDDTLIAANVYYRKFRQDGFNSNINDEFDITLPLEPGNYPAGNIASRTEQTTVGGTVQFTDTRSLFGHTNQATVGLSYDRGRTDFQQVSQDADFSPDRFTFGTTPFGSAQPDVRTSNDYYGVFLTDIFSVSDRLHLTVAGRYNVLRVRLEDQNPSGALNGNHRFKRFNPAVGLNFNASSALMTYVAYNEGMRAPTPMELSCADPAAPCTLPNAFLSDPPLEPVISRTWETGARGKFGTGGWSLALYRTMLDDDIQFISGGSTVTGFFKNVGETRRQGIEVAFDQKFGNLSVAAGLGLIDATFQSPLSLHSPDNSSADASGNITVEPGHRIPGIARTLVKLRADYAFAAGVSLGASVVRASGQYARGDENNQDANGKVPGYTVVNLNARYQLDRQWEFFAKVNNLFDRKYENFGILGANFFDSDGAYNGAAAPTPEQFRSPGAPRAGWLGVKYSWNAAGP